MLNCGHLQCNQRDAPVEQRKDIQEAACNLHSHNYRAVIIFRISFFLCIPVFNGSDDMAWVCRP